MTLSKRRSTDVLPKREWMSTEGWLTDAKGYWTLRFHRDERSWLQDPRIFIDKGRGMPDGSPALLKSRRHLRRKEAEALWKSLRKGGWKEASPVWGVNAEP